MAFRRRKKPDQPELDKLLQGYHASATPPSSPPNAVSTVRCWNCKRPNIYETRRAPPTRCGWCRAVL